jgi:hypothetical protein
MLPLRIHENPIRFLGFCTVGLSNGCGECRRFYAKTGGSRIMTTRIALQLPRGWACTPYRDCPRSPQTGVSQTWFLMEG